jgi:hypothetical protein
MSEAAEPQDGGQEAGDEATEAPAVRSGTQA